MPICICGNPYEDDFRNSYIHSPLCEDCEDPDHLYENSPSYKTVPTPITEEYLPLDFDKDIYYGYPD